MLRLKTACGGRSSLPMAAAAALAALLLPLTACSGSGGNLSTVVSSGAPTTSAKVSASAAAPGTSGATTAGAPAATTAAPGAAVAGPAPADAPGILAKAVEGLRAGYQVDSAVAAENLILTNMTGRVVGPSSLLSVTSGSATVEYLQVPPQVWVREPGGDWKAADTQSTPKDTLAPLAAPTALAFESADGDGQHLKATYDGPSLGMADNPTVDADLVVGPDGAITVRYAATAQGKPLNVLTRLAPSDPTPIVAPA